jgi:hypothetical protein
VNCLKIYMTESLLIRHIPNKVRPQLYILLLITSWAFFLYGMRVTGYVVLEWPAPLGLISYLPWSYWVAFGLLTITSILAFLDKNFNSQLFYLTVLVTLGIYIIGVAVFLEPNSRLPQSYYVPAGARLIMENGRIPDPAQYDIQAYLYWPGLHFVTISILYITGLSDHIEFARYVPLIWPIFFMLALQGIGNRLGMSNKERFILCFLVLSSRFGYIEYQPSSIAPILFLMFIIPIIKSERNIADSLIAILLLIGVIITHSVTSIALILGIVILSIWRKDYLIASLSIILLVAWYLYIAGGAFTQAIEIVRNSFLSGAFLLLNTQGYQTVGPTPVGRLFVRYGYFLFAFLYLLILVRSVIWILRHKSEKVIRQKAGLFLALILGLAFLPLVSQQETVQRAFFFAMPLIGCIFLLTKPSWKFLITVMTIFLMIIPFVRYSQEGIYSYVYSTELKSSAFVAEKIMPEKDIWMYHHPELLSYYLPGQKFIGVADWRWWAPMPTTDIPTYALSGLRWVVMSKPGSDVLMWNFGGDNFKFWPETEDAINDNMIYNNGSEQIYDNRNNPNATGWLGPFD